MFRVLAEPGATQPRASSQYLRDRQHLNIEFVQYLQKRQHLSLERSSACKRTAGLQQDRSASAGPQGFSRTAGPPRAPYAARSVEDMTHRKYCCTREHVLLRCFLCRHSDPAPSRRSRKACACICVQFQLGTLGQVVEFTTRRLNSLFVIPTAPEGGDLMTGTCYCRARSKDGVRTNACVYERCFERLMSRNLGIRREALHG